MQPEEFIDKVISNYRNAIEQYYETESFHSLNHMAPGTVDRFLEHIRPLILELYQTVNEEAPEVNNWGTLDDFLLNFAEIGAKEDEKEPYEVESFDGKKVLRGENKYRIHMQVINVCTDDARNWNYDTFSHDKQLNCLSARKLCALTLLGIDKFEQYTFDEYDRAKISEGYNIIGSEHGDKGCYDHAIDFFKEKLATSELPQPLTRGLLRFYRKLFEPARTKLEFVKKTIKVGPPYVNNNHRNGSEKDAMWAGR